MKVVDFNAIFIGRDELDKKIKKAGACIEEYEKLTILNGLILLY